jgi:hypothetical protein
MGIEVHVATGRCLHEHETAALARRHFDQCRSRTHWPNRSFSGAPRSAPVVS